MSTQTIIAETTDAATATTFQTNGYTLAILAAEGLAGSEECDIWIRTPGGDVLWCGTETAAITLTVTRPMVILPAGPLYAVAKDATAGAAGVYLTLCTSI